MTENNPRWAIPLLTVLAIGGIIWIGFYVSPVYDEGKQWFPFGDKENVTQHIKHTETSSLYQPNDCVVNPMNLTTKRQLPNFTELFPGTLVYSAFYDNTKPEWPYFRIMVISETFRPVPLLCHSRCDSKSTEIARYYLTRGHKKLSHAAFIASCSAPKGIASAPGYIDISAEVEGKMSKIIRLEVISTTKRNGNVHNLTICVPPIFQGGDIQVYNIAEFIEMNKILGATHFIFYNIEIKPNVKGVLAYYEARGLVTVLPWDLPSYLRDFYSIHYHGQVLSIQDCLYRSRGSSKFVAFHDLDEFIVPTEKQTLPELLKKIYKDDICSYRIRSVVFPTQLPPKDKVTKLVTQKYFKRTASYLDARSKCVVVPEKVFVMSIHQIDIPSHPRYKKDWIISEASVFHYRQCAQFEDLEHACESLVLEYRMKMYKEGLEMRVKRVVGSL